MMPLLSLAQRAARFTGDSEAASKKSRKNVSNNSRRRRHKSRSLHPQEATPPACVRGDRDRHLAALDPLISLYRAKSTFRAAKAAEGRQRELLIDHGIDLVNEACAIQDAKDGLAADAAKED